ncbi:hypothetical protein M2447_001314 [Ereboglobus sp. PH5-10]|uniref:hypothetical protein n=1 Tax=Ereboglobus sp. PH5-10 TaxID=2940629 RepID=UPI0024049D7E|nr:hypothetical protein [Ereboglobus sp. PH5-10]MDF9827225.1 hypothetical protein [Ereboglobus sp. PH5-10]
MKTERWIVTIDAGKPESEWRVRSGYLAFDYEANGGWGFSTHDAWIFSSADEASIMASKAKEYYKDSAKVNVRKIQIGGAA